MLDLFQKQVKLVNYGKDDEFGLSVLLYVCPERVIAGFACLC